MVIKENKGMNNKKFKPIDLGNGINVNIVEGRDRRVVEINVSGQKKKLEDTDVNALIDALNLARQELVDNR